MPQVSDLTIDLFQYPNPEQSSETMAEVCISKISSGRFFDAEANVNADPKAVSPPRVGRQNQRYCDTGARLVAGAVPYRFTDGKLQVLLITNTKKTQWIIPKGGWEKDETDRQAAARESEEEAGVKGTIGTKLIEHKHVGKKSNVQIHHYFTLHVEEVLSHWPEGHCRDRRWFEWSAAAELCGRDGMHEAIMSLPSVLKAAGHCHLAQSR